MAQIILDSNNNLIQGDFDNATLNNRTKLQTTTTNATTNVYVVPNGSSTSAGVSVANNSNLTNASKIVMATNGTTDTQIISGVNGSGTYLPLSFYTNNALAAQISTAGNLTLTGGLVVGATAAPAFSVYPNAGSAQAITTSPTKVVMGAVVFDTNSNYSTANSRFTPTVAGYYQFSGSVGGNVNTELLANLYKNGSLLYYGTDSPNVFISQVNALVYMNGSTDYIELYAYSPSVSNNIYQVQARTYLTGFLARSA